MKDFRNPNFTGRGEILDRLDTVAKSPFSKVIVLHGLGGMGKTQIALEYVHSYYEGYSAVFWVDGTSEETANMGFRSVAQRLIDHHISISTTPQPDYARIAQILGLGSAIGEDGQLISAEEGLTNQAVNGWFSKQENKHWLLVLDNVDDLTSFNIRDFIPMASHGTVLITSRRRDCISLGKGLEIDQMPAPEAVLLLLKSAGLDKTDSDAEQSQVHKIRIENPVLTDPPSYRSTDGERDRKNARISSSCDWPSWFLCRCPPNESFAVHKNLRKQLQQYISNGPRRSSMELSRPNGVYDVGNLIPRNRGEE